MRRIWYPLGVQKLHVGQILHTNFRTCHIRTAGLGEHVTEKVYRAPRRP
jgi:hypothetical protein